ncbi:helix-turn-helix domain-containing protein [bacterium]|nr:helix-turn-helix domain-containing protein [bacterium]
MFDFKECDVNELADKLNLSTRQIQRIALSRFKKRPHAFLESLRLHTAINAIVHSKPVSLEAVAKFAGFRTYDAFRKSFHRCFGIAPSKCKIIAVTAHDKFQLLKTWQNKIEKRFTLKE